MKAKLLGPQDTLEVGDLVKESSWAGTRFRKIHRVTAKFAFVKWNDVAEGSFKRDGIANDGWVNLRGGGSYSQVTYKAYRPVEEGETNASV